MGIIRLSAATGAGAAPASPKPSRCHLCQPSPQCFHLDLAIFGDTHTPNPSSPVESSQENHREAAMGVGSAGARGAAGVGHPEALQQRGGPRVGTAMARGGHTRGHSPCARRSRPALEKPPKGGRCRGPGGCGAPSPPCPARGEGGSRPGPVASGVTGQRGTTAERWRGLTPGNWSPSVRREGAGGGATGYLRWWVAGRARGPPSLAWDGEGTGHSQGSGNRAHGGFQELGTPKPPASVSPLVLWRPLRLGGHRAEGQQWGLSRGRVAASHPLAPNRAGPGSAGMAGAGIPLLPGCL